MADPSAASLPTVVFAHNWVEPPKVSTSYETQIEEHVDGTEQRRGLRGKPKRTITTEGMVVDTEDASDLRALLKKRAGGYVYMPLYCDQTMTTSPFTGGSTIPCDTTNRRFAVGSKAIIATWEDFNSSSTLRVVTITNITTTQLTVSETMSGTVPQGSVVYPAIETEVQLGHNVSLESDRIATFKGSMTEKVSSIAIPPSIDAGSIPSGVGSFRGLPVLDIPHDWEQTEEGILRKGRTTDIGLGSATTLFGEDSLDTARLKFTMTSREESYRLIQFFDSCRGALMPFWYPHRAAIAQPTSATTSSITIPDDLPLSEYTDHKVIAVWYIDGSVAVRFVSSAISSSGSHILTLSTPLPSSDVSTMERLSFASLARFASDEMVESWDTDGVMETNLSIQAVPFIGDIACIGQGCEKGECTDEEENCDGPDDPDPDDPGPPYRPKERCLNGTASVPMYYDLTQTWSSGREPIRAADLNMPDTLYIEIRDTLVADTNHPYGQDISDELKEVLYKTHELEYVGEIDRSAKSRNPHHLRVSGASGTTFSGRSGGEEVEDSPAWEAETTYMVGETEHTLTVRMYAEYVDQSTGTNSDTNYGAFGTIFTVWAWSTEIQDAIPYTDGATYAPFNNQTFSYEDPFVGGQYTTEAASVKRMHPHALFVATCPTTWHQPLGYEYFSLKDRNQYKAKCFEQASGAPWSGNSTSLAADNNAFGPIISGWRKRALGSLGGWTKSEFFNWACIENSAGNGMTVLKPTYPGWDESIGGLTTSCDIRMDVCTPPQTAISPCEGHPDGKHQGIGGTHDGWRDNTTAGAVDRLCYSTQEDTTIRVQQACVIKTTTFGSGCDIYRRDCRLVHINETFSGVGVEDYEYGQSDANSANRIITFTKYLTDYSYESMSFPNEDICDPETGCWSVGVGSGDISTQAITASVNGAKNIGYANLYEVPSREDLIDFSIQATTTRTGSQKMGLGARLSVSGGSVNGGYLGIVDEAAGTVSVYKVTSADTVSLLGTESVTIPSGDYEMRLVARGASVTFSVSGSFEASVSIEDCDHVDTGVPGVVALDAGGAVSSISITDNSFTTKKATGSVQGKAELSSSVSFEATKGYIKTLEGGSCEEECDPEDCPSGGCPCTSVCKELQSQVSTSTDAYEG